ncbi:MAG: ester cyclase [Anaerolineae bacterium]|nr:ester cyclase [Anaerolineae bacterium]
MSSEANKAAAMEVLERAFNQGDLSAIDEFIAADGVDHQEAPGTDIRRHLKEVTTNLRTGYPDLHFEMHEILADGDIVSFRATMTGTHTGPLRTGMGRTVPPTGRKVSVAHMYFLRFVDGKNTDLWHIWDTPAMLQQLGIVPQMQAQPN